MKKIPLEPGRAVLSIAGRDSGRRFIALKVEGDYAFIADGDLRKAEKPKKKKRMHLRATPETVCEIADLLREGQTPTNAQLRRCLADRPSGED